MDDEGQQGTSKKSEEHVESIRKNSSPPERSPSPASAVGLSSRLQALLEGIDVECDMVTPKQPPSWLDKKKFEGGQKLFRSHTVGILMSNFRNLVVGFSIPNLCDPLVLTNKSNTPDDALRRYVATAYFLWQWYHFKPWKSDAPWAMVNFIHLSALHSIRRETGDGAGRLERSRRAREIVKKSLEQEEQARRRRRKGDKGGEWSGAVGERTECDLALVRGLETVRRRWEEEDPTAFDAYRRWVGSDLIFSQFDMSMVQWAFFGSFVVVPNWYGARFCSDRELADLVHFWRVVGYYVGVEDRFNMADPAVVGESFRECVAFYREITREIVIPSMLHVNDTALFMGKTVCKGFGANYPLLVYNHAYGHGVEIDGLWEAFSWRQKLAYYFHRFFMGALYIIPPVRSAVCRLLLATMEKMFSGRVAADQKTVQQIRDVKKALPLGPGLQVSEENNDVPAPVQHQ